MAKALLILVGIAIGGLCPQLNALLPALPWIIGTLLLVSFCALPVGVTRPTGLHLGLIAAAWGIGGVACAALWHVDRDLALGALLTGAAPTATAAPVVVAALGGDAAFAALAVLGSNLLACLLYPLLLALLQGGDAPGSPLQLVGRVAPVVLVPWLVSLALRRWRPVWCAVIAAQMERSFLLWLLGLAIVTASASAHIRQAGFHTVLPHAAVAAGLCAIGFVLGHRLGGGRLAVAQSLGQKNTSLATWAALACAGPPAALVPVCYIMAHNLWNAVQLLVRSSDRPVVGRHWRRWRFGLASPHAPQHRRTGRR